MKRVKVVPAVVLLVLMMRPGAAVAELDRAIAREIAAGVVVDQALVYGRGLTRRGPVDLHFDLYRSRKRQPGELTPVVVMLHGGGWMTGSRRARPWVRMASAVAERGLIAAPMTYRLERDEAVLSEEGRRIEAAFAEAFKQWGVKRTPHNARSAAGAFEDLRAMLTWIAEHGAEHGMDKERVILAGGSAGAFTVLNAAYGFEGFLEPAGVNVVAVLAFAGGLIPAHRIQADAPALVVVHGDADKANPVESAHHLKRLAEAAGIAHQFYIVPGGEHALRDKHPLETEVEPGVKTFERILDFLEVQPACR